MVSTMTWMGQLQFFLILFLHFFLFFVQENIIDCDDSESSSDGLEHDTSMSLIGPSTSRMYSDSVCADPVENTAGCSSWSHLKSHFIGMGFPVALVDKVIAEQGEEDADAMLNSLFTYSALENSNLDLDEPLTAINNPSIEETEIAELSYLNNDQGMEHQGSPSNDVIDTKTSLLLMDFSADEIDMAISRLGVEAPLDELVDSIIAAQIAGSSEDKDDNELANNNDVNKESKFKTAGRLHSRDYQIMMLPEELRGKRIKCETYGSSREASEEEGSSTFDDKEGSYNFYKGKSTNFKNIGKGKQPKVSSTDERNAFSTSDLSETSPYDSWMPFEPSPKPSSGLRETSTDSTYFLYGNVNNIPYEDWETVTRFLFGTIPEFIDSQNFSALSRKEGYAHNLPIDTRTHIDPLPQMTIQDVLPRTRKFWPPWDPRTKLSGTNFSLGLTQLCERLERTAAGSKGLPSYVQKEDILHHCKTWNLVWVGPYKLSPLEPEDLEAILGYPRYYTHGSGLDPNERLRLLKDSYQVDTLGYIFSVFKETFPAGINVLSICSGIGGAIVSLHKLGIQINCIVSVESSDLNRRLLWNWWKSTEQRGDLIEIDDVEKLKSRELDNLMGQVGGFDVVIGGNPSKASVGSSRGPMNGPECLDQPHFFEFIRILNYVRAVMAKKRSREV
ncbi:probable inactive DNA (cytosine-5)-methyltransferase DRM3 isoform X3 [Amborella trichopoda]|uniref:probable inactive DNA (cytosine-5)-methyltransferase DRM3 isoform X3 n=1 Tax=Amborella trichopoda TaxID=13333 RepID=UPI0009BD5497|nr:probable inactive DNA (cytosine-5)-methyltransferase DRM3 isoform X3 [Amborella trichopoda]|eukprot:XP_020521107.1 probable inactive DNA (cytosine-5)-methyltransferase DRM3 isoform X3 [Amborella trichopoda]